ncbi:ankyrin repeat domain-containing protein [Marinomonas arenicola]|uniref:Ankyrin repeat domain-containing protein n=1 Tax=Marinomonas arenicola TaxID=569601 RepID=A0ABU9G8M2_9GAMM
MKKYLPIFLLSSPFLYASSYDDCLNLTAHELLLEPSGFVEYDDVDWRKALPFCEKAVAENPDNFKALYSLSRVYSRQFDELGDKELAEKMDDYVERSYRAGFGHAAWVLAIGYYESQEWDQAMYWLDLNAKDGSVDAINEKAVWLFDSEEAYPNKNYREASDTLKSAVNSDNKYVHFNLASLHYYDKYGMLDYELALKHFKKAASLGHVRSLYVLGEMYHNGFGTPKDPEKSTEYYLAAKKAGYKSGDIDKRLSQSAMNTWLKSEEGEGYEYYDLSINTIRSLAVKNDPEAKKFLRQQRIASSPDKTPLDYFLVASQGDAYLLRASKYIDSYIETKNPEAKEKVSKALKNYFNIMVANGVYSEPIKYFKKIVDQGYGPFFNISNFYLAKMYVMLFLDYEHESDGIKALTSAMLTDNKDILESVAFGIHSVTDKATYDNMLAVAGRINKNYNIDFVINRYEQALKRDMSDLAMIYVKDSSIDINDRRSNDGVSMLHLAIWHNNTDIAKQLIERGADINLADRQGDKPLGYAIYKRNMELIEYLNKLGAKN